MSCVAQGLHGSNKILLHNHVGSMKSASIHTHAVFLLNNMLDVYKFIQEIKLWRRFIEIFLLDIFVI
jgi:hypothetical protein